MGSTPPLEVEILTGDTNESIKKLLEEKRDKSYQGYEDYKEMLEFITGLNFEVGELRENQNKFTIYINNFSLLTDYRIMTRNYNAEHTDLGPYDGWKLNKVAYSKIFEFYANKKFESFELEMIMRDIDMSKKGMDVIYNFTWTSENSKLWMPNTVDTMLGLYKERGMNHELMKKTTDALKIAEALVKV